jgi:hypothetical protein
MTIPFKTFRQYVEDNDQNSPEDIQNMPGIKARNGLADPDPGEVKKPHKPNSKDVDLAKSAIQIMMGRNAKWHYKLWKFLRSAGERIPEIGHIVDQMSKPKNANPPLGFKEKEPDELAPNSADGSPAFYQQD